MVVLMTTSDDCGPTAFGLKVAWKENDAPAATVAPVAGMLETTKLASPVKVTFTIVTPMLALQVIVFASVSVFRLEVPNSVGDVQFKGELTGDPKPYKNPLLVPR